MQENQREPLNKRALFTYILIALGFTWVCWIPSLLWAGQNDAMLPTISMLATETPFSFANQQHILISLLFSVAVYGPLLGGFVATYMARGGAGTRDLVSRMLRWRVGGRWYVTAVLIVLAITLLPLALGLLLGMAEFKPGQPSFALTTFLFLLLFQMLTSGLGEEPGWRGYLLPTLQASYSQRRAIWIMGIIWAVWHFPFTIYATLSSLDPALGAPAVAVIVPALIGQTMSLIGIAYLYTWMLNHTGSLFLLIFFHALSNTVPEMATRAIVPRKSSGMMATWGLR